MPPPINVSRVYSTLHSSAFMPRNPPLGRRTKEWESRSSATWVMISRRFIGSIFVITARPAPRSDVHSIVLFSLVGITWASSPTPGNHCGQVPGSVIAAHTFSTGASISISRSNLGIVASFIRIMLPRQHYDRNCRHAISAPRPERHSQPDAESTGGTLQFARKSSGLRHPSSGCPCYNRIPLPRSGEGPLSMRRR